VNDRRTASTITDAELDELYNGLDGAYRERAHLVAYLAALYPAHIGRTDPNAPDWPVLIIETPAGQMSWHFAERDLDLVGRVQPTGPEHSRWDGHSTEEKYERLRALTAAPRTAEATLTRVLTAIHIADDEDVTDWQRGYRACATNARRALDDPTPDTAATQATRPREHCGHLKPQFFPSSKTTECVLHPGHPGSHADDRGCRWQPIAEERPHA
jgi:hypothetical protein